MKCGNCKTELKDDVEFCVKCGTAVSDAVVILCSGIRKDGTPCGAELLEGYNFCGKCGRSVDQTLFQKKQRKCQGVMQDGSFCGSLLNEDNEYCIKCGTHQDATPSSYTVISIPEQDVNTSSSSTAAAASYAQESVFGLCAKLDGERLEHILASRFPSSSTQDLEDLSGDGVKESHLDVANTGQSPASGSSDSVTFGENDSDSDPEEEKANFSLNVDSGSGHSADLGSKPSPVTPSEDKGDDLEVILEDDFSDDINDNEEDNECSHNESLASTADQAEDNVTKPTSIQSVQAKEQKITGQKWKKNIKRYKNHQYP